MATQSIDLTGNTAHVELDIAEARAAIQRIARYCGNNELTEGQTNQIWDMWLDLGSINTGERHG